MSIEAVIFDMDGVLVTTDECHYRAWKSMADDEGIYFDREINERLRGVSRLASLDIILEQAQRVYSDAEKLELAQKKNLMYIEYIKQLKPENILPGVIDNLNALRENGIKTAVGSSSKNTPIIMEQLNIGSYFDAVSDGNNISRSKPDPEVFIKAADMLGIPYKSCVVVEDADTGIEAAKKAGMIAVAVGNARGGDLYFPSLDGILLTSKLGIVAEDAS